MKQIGVTGKNTINIGKKTFNLEERLMNDVLTMQNFVSSKKTTNAENVFMMAVVVKDAMKRCNKRFLFFYYSAGYIMHHFTASQLQEAFRIVIEDLEGGRIEKSKSKKVEQAEGSAGT